MQDLDAKLDATVMLETNHTKPELRGPFDPKPLLWPLRFANQRKDIDGTHFPQLKIPVGLINLVIKRTAGGNGSFDAQTGKLEIPINLHLDYVLGTATVALLLTTDTSGSPGGAFHLTGKRMDPASGQCVLVAASTLIDVPGGLLDGTDVSVRISGKMVPNPMV